MDSSERRFAMRWSGLSWLVTIGVCIVVVLVSIVILRMAANVGPGATARRGLLIVVAFLPLAIFGILALFTPLGFKVTSDALVVRRLGRNVVIPRVEIRETRRVEAGQAGLGWRLKRQIRDQADAGKVGI